MIPAEDSHLVKKVKYFLLEEGDIIKIEDEYYNNFQDRWLFVEEEWIGQEFRADESKPVRRKNLKYKGG